MTRHARSAAGPALAALATVWMGLVGLAGVPASAQVLGGGDGPQPLEVTADQAIELHEQQRAYVARGRASATRGDTTINADVLVGYYRDAAAGGTEIYRLMAEGNVSIVSPSRQVYGQRAVYDIDQQVALVTGDNLRMVTRNDIVTAKDSLEFWERERLAVARGDALAIRGANRVSADTLVALIADGAGGASEVERLDARGGVVIVTETDVVRGREAVYDVRRNVATVLGDVRATRGQNQLNGEAAEVDFRTGISRMIRSPAAALPAANQPPQRVRGLFVPGQRPGEGLLGPGQAGARPDQPGAPAPPPAAAPPAPPPAAPSPAAPRN